MTLRIYHEEDGSHERRIQSKAVPESNENGMPRFEKFVYVVFPSYGEEFNDLAKWRYRWETLIPQDHVFWQGFSQGGILALPPYVSGKKNSSNIFNSFPRHMGYQIAWNMGNESAREMSEYAIALQPHVHSKIEVLLGAPKVRIPKVLVTPEHIDSAQCERFLLIVPREHRKKIKHLDSIPRWLETFGIAVREGPSSPPAPIRDEMRDWFWNIERPMYAYRIEGGVCNAAWQTAVIMYIGNHMSVMDNSVNTIHFIANIEGKPHFRKYWTSNK